jgi:hypothetical protein
VGESSPVVADLFNAEIATLQARLGELFDQHPDAKIYRGQPGLGLILGARVLGEFGYDPGRYAGAQARESDAGNSPLPRKWGKKKTVHARGSATAGWPTPFISRVFRDDRFAWRAGLLSGAQGARHRHHAALRQLSNRFGRYLAWLSKTRTPYDEQPRA